MLDITEKDFTQQSVLVMLKAKIYLLCFVPTANCNFIFKTLIKMYSVIIYHEIFFLIWPATSEVTTI